VSTDSFALGREADLCGFGTNEAVVRCHFAQLVPGCAHHQ